MANEEVIKLSKKLKAFLNSKKLCKGESYDQVIRRLLKRRGFSL